MFWVGYSVPDQETRTILYSGIEAQVPILEERDAVSHNTDFEFMMCSEM